MKKIFLMGRSEAPLQKDRAHHLRPVAARPRHLTGVNEHLIGPDRLVLGARDKRVGFFRADEHQTVLRAAGPQKALRAPHDLLFRDPGADVLEHPFEGTHRDL